MVRYAAYQYFWFLWLVPVVAGGLAYSLWRQREALRAFVGPGSLARSGLHSDLWRPMMRAACVVAAVTLIVVAITQPQWGTYLSQQRAVGRDIFVAVDVSRSMLADDVSPSRLERAKADVRDLVTAVEESGGHRVGLIAFAGAASVKCPLTQVTNYFKIALDGLGDRSVARGGTLIGDCIRLAIESFDDKTQNFRDLILITDGEDMDSFPLEAAAAARDAGVTIYTIGLGDSEQGSRVPVADKQGQRSFLQHDGEIVWSKLNPTTLRQIAETTSGVFVPAGTRAIELDRIFRDVIEPKTKRELGETRRERLHHRFQWFLATAFFLLFGEMLMTAMRRSADPSSRPRSPDARSTDNKSRMTKPEFVLRVLLVLLLSVVIAASTSRTALADDARSLVRDGNRLYQEGKFVEAAERYAQAAERAPESAVPLFNRAAALFQAGQYAEAAKLYEQARPLAPEPMRRNINFALGNCHLQQAIAGRTQPDLATREARAALPFYRDAITRDPYQPDADSVNQSSLHNAELAKRLIMQLQKEQQQQQDQRQEDSKQDQSNNQGQPRPKPSDDPNPEKKDQPRPSSSEEPRKQSPPTAAQPAEREELSSDDAAERLRAAIARAQMARARRLSVQDKRAKGAAVVKDW
jgi:Ca-activated chloride channel family protein